MSHSNLFNLIDRIRPIWISPVPVSSFRAFVYTHRVDVLQEPFVYELQPSPIYGFLVSDIHDQIIQDA